MSENIVEEPALPEDEALATQEPGVQTHGALPAPESTTIGSNA